MKNANFCKNNKGITLIALVLTIIILMILAGVSASLIMGEHNIIQRSKEQKIAQAKAEILQELELAKGPVTIEETGYTSLEKNVSSIKEKRIK